MPLLSVRRCGIDSTILRVSEIVLDNVSKVFSGGVVAVDGVSLTIGSGEFLVLVGPSGCGKSTLLRMIAGLEEVTSGTISIGERDVTDLPPRARDIAMVFQSYALYPHMTVRQNLGYGLKVRKTSKHEIKERVARAAQLLGLDELLDRKPAALSGGQRQRVAMGRAIVREPQGTRDGPRDRAGPSGVPDGRAALESRRKAPREHARPARGAPRPAGDDDDLCHARPDRGDDARTACGRHAGRADPTGRHAAGAVRAPGQPVRGRVHRLPGDEPRRSRGRRRPGALRRLHDPVARDERGA